jgi:hypothetical protein
MQGGRVVRHKPPRTARSATKSPIPSLAGGRKWGFMVRTTGRQRLCRRLQGLLRGSVHLFRCRMLGLAPVVAIAGWI